MSGAQQTGQWSISDHSCQVREKDAACLSRPVVEVAMFFATPRGAEQRSVRACALHHHKLAAHADNQIVAVRPYTGPSTAVDGGR